MGPDIGNQYNTGIGTAFILSGIKSDRERREAIKSDFKLLSRRKVKEVKS